MSCSVLVLVPSLAFGEVVFVADGLGCLLVSVASSTDTCSFGLLPAVLVCSLGSMMGDSTSLLAIVGVSASAWVQDESNVNQTSIPTQKNPLGRKANLRVRVVVEVCVLVSFLVVVVSPMTAESVPLGTYPVGCAPHPVPQPPVGPKSGTPRTPLVSVTIFFAPFRRLLMLALAVEEEEEEEEDTSNPTYRQQTTKYYITQEEEYSMHLRE